MTVFDKMVGNHGSMGMYNLIYHIFLQCSNIGTKQILVEIIEFNMTGFIKNLSSQMASITQM